VDTANTGRMYRIEPLVDPVPFVILPRLVRKTRSPAPIALGSADGSVPTAPDYFRPVVGWRTWLVVVTPAGARLRSVVFGTDWPPGEKLLARCELTLRRTLRRPFSRAAKHQAPAADCECGIWAAKEIEDAAGYFQLYDDILGQRSVHRVIGRVSLWGSVAESGLGWRASHAYPTHLYVPTHREDRRRVDAEKISVELADYGVPVEVVGRGVGEEVGRALAEICGPERNRIGQPSAR
jgi:hypothetical protein